MYIDLKKNGKDVLVNLDTVLYVEPSNDGKSYIRFSLEGSTMKFDNSLREVYEKIQQEELKWQK